MSPPTALASRGPPRLRLARNVPDIWPGPPLLAAAARRWAWALLGCCVVLVAVLGVLFAHQTTPDSFDRAVDSPVISSLGGHQGLALWLAAAGSSIPATVFCAAIVVACLLARRPNGAILAAVGLLAAAGLNDGLLKHLVHRTYLGVLSYPSGHTAAIFALATAVAVLCIGSPQPATTGPLRLAIPALACLVGIAVAVGVIALQWHYFTDTVAGAALGIAVICGLALILDLPAVRRALARAGRKASALSGGARVVDRGPMRMAWVANSRPTQAGSSGLELHRESPNAGEHAWRGHRSPGAPASSRI
jgi:membrane-associated phospholipid phosphatase